MTVGTLVVGAILAAIVVAIIVYMVRSHRAGKHVGCSECGACGSSGKVHNAHEHGNCGCVSVESMIERMNNELK